jgi:hypothetical protein
MVNSHIQMPKQVMKNFTNEHGQFYFYDFENKKVRMGHPKTLYTERGYFSDDVEDFLGAEVESDLGALLKFIKETEFEAGDEPPLQYGDIAFNYVYSLLARSPSFQEELNSNSVFYQLFSKRDQHDIAAHDGYLMAKEKNILRQYSISFLDNKTSEKLVLPTGGMTPCNNRIFCPVTPRRAIVLDDIRMEEEDGKSIVAVYEIADQEVIHLINRMSFIQEMKRDKKYVISLEKDLLLYLVDENEAMEVQLKW